MKNSKILTLYHGSRSGIRGPIAPISRERCDFGKGFYMGTDISQPLTLICNYSDAKIYTLSVNLNDLKILNMEEGLDWALLVAYYRGKMELVRGSRIYKLFAKMGKQYVALTEKACKNLKILNEQELSEQDRDKLKQESEANRSQGIVLADEMCRRYRREGRFFDEILKAGESYGESGHSKTSAL